MVRFGSTQVAHQNRVFAWPSKVLSERQSRARRRQPNPNGKCQLKPIRMLSVARPIAAISLQVSCPAIKASVIIAGSMSLIKIDRLTDAE